MWAAAWSGRPDTLSRRFAAEVLALIGGHGPNGAVRQIFLVFTCLLSKSRESVASG